MIHKQNLSKINLITVILFVAINMLYGEAITKPLFMQIKSPKLESVSGILVDKEANEYQINTDNKDSIDISFVITVPKEMLSELWAISLTPSIESTREDGRLKDVVIKGAKFAEEQEQDYKQYDAFVNSIVDSSEYEKVYIDKEQLEKEIEQRHDMYWQYYYDEWERQVEYEIWKSKQDGSSKTYSLANRKTYRDQLYKQYLLRIKNQSSRYLKANMDTTGLYAKYMKEFQMHDAKMPRYIVDNNISSKSVPQKYKDIYESRRTLDDITESMQELLEKKDSTLMALLPALDYQKIKENEKRTILQSEKDIRSNLIRLPKNENTLLDTVVHDLQNDYQYRYTYRYPVVKGLNDTVKVKLASKILATDRSGFSSSAEEVLTYIVTATKEYDGNNKNNGISDIKDKLKALSNAATLPPVLPKEVKENVTNSKGKENITSESSQSLSDRLQQFANPIQNSNDSIRQPVKGDEKEPNPNRGIGSRIQILE